LPDKPPPSRMLNLKPLEKRGASPNGDLPGVTKEENLEKIYRTDPAVEKLAKDKIVPRFGLTAKTLDHRVSFQGQKSRACAATREGKRTEKEERAQTNGEH